VLYDELRHDLEVDFAVRDTVLNLVVLGALMSTLPRPRRRVRPGVATPAEEGPIP
jgi:hypothetical protein